MRSFSPTPIETDGEAANPGPKGCHHRLRNIWSIATVNPTTWTAMVPILARQQFDVVLVQEMLRHQDRVAYAEVEGNRAGHHTRMNGSLRTAKAGCSAGVVVATRWAHGITAPSLGDPITKPPPHRFAFHHWHAFLREASALLLSIFTQDPMLCSRMRSS